MTTIPTIKCYQEDLVQSIGSLTFSCLPNIRELHETGRGIRAHGDRGPGDGELQGVARGD